MEEKFTYAEAGQSSVFDGADGVTQIEREGYQRGIRKARRVLFFAGILMFVIDFILLLAQREQFDDATFYLTIAIDAVILAIFIALGFWTKKKPYSAILAGLIFFCLIQLVVMVIDPTNIYKGIVVKVIVIVSLISGLRKAKALQQLDRFASGNF